MSDFNDSDFATLTTVQTTTHHKSTPTATAREPEGEEPHTSKHNPTPVLTSHSLSKSRTPFTDSILPTTLHTLASTSSAWDYPYPTSRISKASLSSSDEDESPTSHHSSSSSNKNTDNSTELAQVEAQLKTYKMHYRNMIIALTLFALLVVSFVAFKIWWFIQKRKKHAAMGAIKVGRKWFGSQANKPRKGPGGVEMI